MYGLAGERRLTELELPWLAGYENSRPVRTGNAAHKQIPARHFGEISGCHARRPKARLAADENAWRLEQHLMEHLEKIWHEPDEGIWEVRGPRRISPIPRSWLGLLPIASSGRSSGMAMRATPVGGETCAMKFMPMSAVRATTSS